MAVRTPTTFALASVSVGLSFGALVAAGCTSVAVNPDHCSNNDGDAYCARASADRPLCSNGNMSSCNTDFSNGCVAEDQLAEGCHDPCGNRSDGECQDVADSSSGSDSGSSSGPSTDTDPSTETGATTTGPTACNDSSECTDSNRPFCSDEGECVPCGDAPTPEDGDAACLAADEMVPLCVGGTCVACSEQNTDACDAQLLLCDTDSNSCVGCTAHDQCDIGACQLANGMCFPPDSEVLRVDGNGDGSEDHGEIQPAVNSVDDGGFGVIRINELNGTTPYTESIVVDAGKTVALLAVDGETPRLQGTGGPGLFVEGADTTTYVDQVIFSGGGTQSGIRADGGTIWVDRTIITSTADGGIVVDNGATLTLRTSTIGDGDTGVIINGSTASILYSTILTDFNPVSDLFTVQCVEPQDVTIRNSFFVSFDDAIELDCVDATISFSAGQSEPTGSNNVALGAFQADWFVDFNTGNLLLDNPPAALGTTASWTEGDPTVDITGDPRPTKTGANDFAGADRLP